MYNPPLPYIVRANTHVRRIKMSEQRTCASSALVAVGRPCLCSCERTTRIRGCLRARDGENVPHEGVSIARSTSPCEAATTSA